ncbi:unnamed protein product [Rotaria sp. Silwood2]|nr:unnamed protein product [Rotaria sp. Silwood2]CAF3932391.1 unnamed protein product [Rotaria sp. Silwood2]CAF4056793.1 unnamed protein product [Rotaria sp. Silwood2]
MSIYSNSTIYCLTLNIFSSIFEIISFVISLILLCFIVYRFIFNNYVKNSLKHNIPIILSINALCLHVVKSFIQFISVNFKTLQRDFYFIIEPNDSSFCRFYSYLFFSIISALYWSYVLQAIFRFTRVLYPRSLRLHQSNTYLYLFIPGQILLSCSSVLPFLVVFNSICLIPDEIYCSISMEEYIPLIYFILVIFCLPMSIIFVFYICLICKIRLLLFTNSFRQRNQRDYIAIRRIILVIFIVSITSVPAVIDIIVYSPKRHHNPFIYRLQWISSSLNSLIFIVSLPFVNPQLFEFLKKSQKYTTCNIPLHTT